MLVLLYIAKTSADNQNFQPPPPQEFCEALYALNSGNYSKPKGKRLQVVQDPEYRRLGSRVDLNLALELFNVDW